MSSVTHLTQFLLRLDPSKSVARQTLFNYLKVFHDANEALKPEVFNQFFSHIVNYQYWQSNARTLGESLHQDVQRFAQEYRIDFEMSSVRFPHQVQIVLLEHGTDLECLIKKREATLTEEGDRLKLFSISDNQSMAILLKKNGHFEVRIYSRAAFVNQGELDLTKPLTQLYYTIDVELEPFKWQTLEGPVVTLARFRLNDDGCQGTMIRGHMLQRYETMASGALSQHPELFYSLKRVERHFINPPSDPFYRDLVMQLEKAKQLMRLSHPDGRRVANGALHRAKSALQNIFPNDKVLSGLVTNVEFALMSQTTEPWTEISTN